MERDYIPARTRVPSKSLGRCFEENEDERVEEAIEELLEGVWTE